jgi:DNA topoisomerase-2
VCSSDLFIINKINRELALITNKARFIADIIEGKLKINNVPKQEILRYLEKSDYDKIDGSYNYLLNLSIYSLTKERFEELLKEKSEKQTELSIIKNTDHKDMYMKDLLTLKQLFK